MFHGLSASSTGEIWRFCCILLGIVPTLLDDFRHIIAHSPRRYAPATVTKRVNLVARWLSAVDDPWTATVFDVEQWAHGLKLSPTSTRDAISHVRAFYRWAIRTGRTAADPTATVELGRIPRRLPRPARDVAIAAAIGSACPQMRAMLALMAGAGFRCCEIAGLRWVDIDVMSRTVLIRGKFDRERVITLGRDVMHELAAIDHPGLYVFTDKHGRHLEPWTVSQKVNEHLRTVGAGATAHQLRHRYATTALAACRDITVVRDLLGHTSVSTTEVYAMVTPGLASEVTVAVPGLGR